MKLTFYCYCIQKCHIQSQVDRIPNFGQSIKNFNRKKAVFLDQEVFLVNSSHQKVSKQKSNRRNRVVSLTNYWQKLTRHCWQTRLLFHSTHVAMKSLWRIVLKIIWVLYNINYDSCDVLHKILTLIKGFMRRLWPWFAYWKRKTEKAKLGVKHQTWTTNWKCKSQSCSQHSWTSYFIKCCWECRSRWNK